MDAKELVAIVNRYGFEAKSLYRYATQTPDEYKLELVFHDIIEVSEDIIIIDYREGEFPYITPFALLVKEGENYALYIDEADKDVI